MNFETIFFFLVAGVAIGSAIMMISQRNPIKSVLFLVLNFFCLAIIYLILQAQFIAVIQILVYTGAIMVLVLFVIMLLNLGNEEHERQKISYTKLIAWSLAGTVFMQLMLGIGLSANPFWFEIPQRAEHNGTVESIGKVMYTQYLFPFEVTSLILLAAIVGVVVLAKRKLD